MHPDTAQMLTDLAREIHGNAVDKGFWEPMPEDALRFPSKMMHLIHDITQVIEFDRQSGHGLPAEQIVFDGAVGEFLVRLALVVSEVGEALDAWQADDRAGTLEELADAVIRIFDLAAGEFGAVSFAEAILEKMARNRERPRKHGKRY